MWIGLVRGGGQLVSTGVSREVTVECRAFLGIAINQVLIAFYSANNEC